MRVQERFDVADIDDGPISFATAGGRKIGEVAQGG
jgi:hypothetical protein